MLIQKPSYIYSVWETKRSNISSCLSAWWRMAFGWTSQARMRQINMHLWLSAHWHKEYMKFRPDIVIFSWNHFFLFYRVSNCKDIWLHKPASPLPTQKNVEVIFYMIFMSVCDLHLTFGLLTRTHSYFSKLAMTVQKFIYQ